MVAESVHSSVADLLSLEIRGVKAMSTASVLEVHFGALKLTTSSSNTQIGELESQNASTNSESDATAVELRSTERPLRFAKRGDCLMQQLL